MSYSIVWSLEESEDDIIEIEFPLCSYVSG